MPSWIGPWEIVIVIVVILLVFGPKKLPEFGSSIGRSIVGLKKGLKEGTEEMRAAMKEDEPAGTGPTAAGMTADAGMTATDTMATDETTTATAEESEPDTRS